MAGGATPVFLWIEASASEFRIQNPEFRIQKQEAGSWKLEAGSWKLEE